MDREEFKTAMVGTFVGTLVADITFFGGCLIYRLCNKSKANKPTLSEELGDAQAKLEVYEVMCTNLKKESLDITSYITENTLNVRDMKTFNISEYRDKLTTVNDAWREAESKKKYYQEYIKSLIDKIQSS